MSSATEYLLRSQTQSKALCVSYYMRHNTCKLNCPRKLPNSKLQTAVFVHLSPGSIHIQNKGENFLPVGNVFRWLGSGHEEQ